MIVYMVPHPEKLMSLKYVDQKPGEGVSLDDFHQAFQAIS